MSFIYRGQLNGAQNPVTADILIADSQTVSVGDCVKLQTLSSGGGAMRATAGVKLLGIVVGIVDDKGIDLDNTNPSNFDGTWTSSSKTYAAASNNTTVKKVRAKVVSDPMSLWYNDSAGTLVAADEYKYFDLSTYAVVADQDGHDTAGSLLLIKRDPDGDADASKGIFKLVENQLSISVV